MRSWTVFLKAFLLAAPLALSLAGCRQPDGPLPVPTEDAKDEIGELARDMINVINRESQAEAELASDVSKYGSDIEAVDASRELARRLTDVLPSAKLDEQSAQRLAHTMWVGVTATELSARQIEAMQNEAKEILRSAGVEEPRADAVAQQLGVVQQEITHNPKRWYQVF
jgi:predicted small lipoprotein YifL